MPNSSLVISEISIRQDNDNRYCLNDLHKASGGDQKSQPRYWLANKQTQNLINELDSENPLTSEVAGITATSISRGIGSYAVKELVYAYAMWISASFHLKVIRAYDSLVTQNQVQHQPSQNQVTINLNLDGKQSKERYLLTVVDGVIQTRPMANNEFIFTTEQVKNNIADLVPHHRLIPSKLYLQLMDIKKQLEVLA